MAMKHGLPGHLSTIEAEIKALDAGIVFEYGNNLINQHDKKWQGEGLVFSKCIK